MSLFSFNTALGKFKDIDGKVRPMAVAGSFYPAQKDSLAKLLDTLFAHTPQKQNTQVAAIIVPHAGYVFSGQVAADAFAQINPSSQYEHLFLIGPSHHVYMEGASVNNAFGYYETPLGKVEVDTALAKRLIENQKVFSYKPEAHDKEHCLEVQLPFLQHQLKQMPPIVPIIIGTQSLSVIEKIAEALRPYFNAKNLFVISSDFSHYPSYEDANRVDGLSGKAIEGGKLCDFIEAIRHNEELHIPNLATSACGQSAIAALLYLIGGEHNISIRHLTYRNSGDSEYGERGQVVGYHSFVFYRDKSNVAEHRFFLSRDDKKLLLKIARKSIRNRLLGNREAACDTIELPEILKSRCGVFVTLYEDGRLRGCIGHFGEDVALFRIAKEMAVAAAFEDPRFMPLSRSELDRVHIEMSVLTPLKKIDSINDFHYGKEGIYISKGGRSGTFLPQVAQETHWTKEEFLGHCAQDKAGLSWEGWKDADLYTYEAIIFKEDE